MERHPNSARFHEILKELGDLHDKKQGDYGRGNDPFANVRSSTEWGVKPWVGAMIRANDKVRRLQSLIQNGKLNNESAEDSLRDLAVYSIISLVLFEEDRQVVQQGVINPVIGPCISTTGLQNVYSDVSTVHLVDAPPPKDHVGQTFKYVGKKS